MSQWHCIVQGQQYGPVDEPTLRDWIKAGRLQPSDNVWTEGMAEWQPASQVPQLADAFANAPGQQTSQDQPGQGNQPYSPVQGLYQQPQPQMPQEPIGYTPARPLKPHRGTQVLIFGILGLVCCIIFGIIAWSQGSSDIKEMDAGIMDPSGRGTTQAGKILGMISCILAIIGLIVQLGALGSM